MGYRTCYYRTFNVGPPRREHDAYKKAREWLDKGIVRIRPAVTTAHICEVFPKAQDFGFPNETSAFGLQFTPGIGCAIHERPIIYRIASMDHPTTIKEGMVFAIETYSPASDGYAAARIEEEIVVTDTGGRLITLFPAENLPITARDQGRGRDHPLGAIPAPRKGWRRPGSAVLKLSMPADPGTQSPSCRFVTAIGRDTAVGFTGGFQA